MHNPFWPLNILLKSLKKTPPDGTFIIFTLGFTVTMPYLSMMNFAAAIDFSFINDLYICLPDCLILLNEPVLNFNNFNHW